MIVLCYLVVFDRRAPVDADAVVRKARPHISRKWEEPVVARCARDRDTLIAMIDGELATAVAVGGREGGFL